MAVQHSKQDLKYRSFLWKNKKSVATWYKLLALYAHSFDTAKDSMFPC